MHRVAVPQLFENMEEATIGKWLVAPGQTVQKEQPLCELITEKVTLELPAEAEGVVRQLVAPDKAIVPTGFIIALIGDADEELPDVDAENAKFQAPATVAPATVAPATVAPAPKLAPTLAREAARSPASATGGGRLRATPAARRAAKVAGVALEAVAAQFPDKVISEDDVKAYADSAGAGAA